MFQVEIHGQRKFSAPLQARGYEVLVVVFYEDRGPYVRTGNQGGPPILADVRHLHGLEHRASSPWPRDEFGDGYYGFRRKLAYKTELVLGHNDTPDCIFKGGLEHLQLFSSVSVTRGYQELRHTCIVTFNQATS